MNYYVSLENAIAEQNPGHISFDLLTEENGCKNGCTCGISRYTAAEYQPPGCHEDQEGFFVLAGSGYAQIGKREFPIHPGIAFIAPAGVAHAIRTEDPNVPIEVFWFHAAI